MTSSFVSELAVIWGPLPMIALGTPAILAGLTALNLPETKGLALPETLDEALDLNVSLLLQHNFLHLRKSLQLQKQDRTHFDLGRERLLARTEYLLSSNNNTSDSEDDMPIK